MTNPKTEHYHVIKITGNLIFESRHENFRVALRDYLKNSTDDGIQLQIIDMNNKDEHPEDVVVNLSLVKMRQHPEDMKVCVENKIKPLKPIKAIRPVQPKTVNGSDTCFY